MKVKFGAQPYICPKKNSMKKTVFRYGIISFAALCALGLINYLASIKIPNYNGAIGGYISILLSSIFIYFGIKQFRDKENGGFVSYKQAFLVGILIVIFPSLANGLYNVIYVKFIDPGFIDKYYDLAIQNMKVQLPPDQFQVKLQSLESERTTFKNPYLQFIMMFLTVFFIGVIVTAISSLVLCKKTKAKTV
jgi:hypothetical protein